MAQPENSFPKRLRRYASVSGSMANQAARYAGRRILTSGGEEGRERQAKELKDALGGLKGPLMKVAQMLATIPHALPKEYARELAQLQSQAPAMGPPFVKRRMKGELGGHWQQHFKEFPLQASAAASLGQVHKAVLKDGMPVACKLQYPDIAAAVEADLAQLKVIFSIYRRYDRAIDPQLIYQEIAQRLREELDYDREAKNLNLYRLMLEGVQGVHVPEVVDYLTTSRLLTMNWLEGTPLMHFKEAGQEERNQIAIHMFLAWYTSFYQFGVIHGDPHLGNYTVREDHGINLLDFGCIRIFPSSFVKGVIDLYWAIERDDEELAVQAYGLWGFKDLKKETIAVLNEWARFLYAPLLEDRIRPIDEDGHGSKGPEVVNNVHKELRKLGGVAPPREFVLMDRAALGLGSVFMHLRAEVNWHRMFMSMVDKFDEQALIDRRHKTARKAGFEGQIDELT